MNITRTEDIMYLIVIVSFILIAIAFCAGLFFGRREGYLKGKLDGKRESNSNALKILSRSIQ